MNFSETLLRWYDQNRRSLPWRGTRDPYRIWLSEIMLQQTRTETVERYYAKFLSAYPTVSDLARADQDEVLKLWEGLGYYSRARNLHAAAKRVSNDLKGHFPSTATALRELPGVGPYAANAIASIAYDECVPALDGNQARVLSRVLAHDVPLRTPFDLLEPAQELMSIDRPGDYNQALMDLGSSVCTPRSPRCSDCPVSGFCCARAAGDPQSFPRKQPPIVKRESDLTIIIATDGTHLFVRKRPPKGLLAGLYEFPSVDGHPSANELPAMLELQGFANARFVRMLPDSKHVFTHLIWRMKGALVCVEAAPSDFIPITSLDTIALSSALKVYREIALEILSEHGSCCQG